MWKVFEKGIFSVKSYKFLCFEVPLSFPDIETSASKVSSKVSFFGWELTWDKIFMIDRPSYEKQVDFGELLPLQVTRRIGRSCSNPL